MRDFCSPSRRQEGIVESPILFDPQRWTRRGEAIAAMCKQGFVLLMPMKRNIKESVIYSMRLPDIFTALSPASVRQPNEAFLPHRQNTKVAMNHIPLINLLSFI
jgi:hypothetical protein